MADVFHCIDGSALQVFGKAHRNKGRAPSTESSGSSGPTEDSADAPAATRGPIEDSADPRNSGPLVRWMKTQTLLRNLLCRGHGNYHLSEAYKACGVSGRPQIQTASKTRMVVYSSDMLRP